MLSISAAGLLGSGASAEPSSAELQAELDRQRELLERLMAEPGSQDPRDESDSRSATDPRRAPRAPEVRELPVAIFDETKVAIPPGEWGNAQRLLVVQRFLDADGDGRPELLRFVDPESGYLLRQEEDRDYDGKLDAWSDFEWGALVRRSVDDDGDGRADGFEDYARGRMTRREVDRDGDGVRDAFYVFRDGDLTLEKHDANDDGKIDREVRYEARVRVDASEDSDYDGTVDTWYRFAVRNGSEMVVRIERDVQGRGKPDVFETFDEQAGKAVLARREEDVDGDGRADIVSTYRAGKLVRRELAKPGLRPL